MTARATQPNQLRLDGANNQLQLSQTAANQGEMLKFTRYRISFKELPSMLHDGSSKFKARRTEAAGRQKAESRRQSKRLSSLDCLLPCAFCLPTFSLLSYG
jgi:hypothetical protein